VEAPVPAHRHRLDDHCGYEHEEMTDAEIAAFRALDASPTEGNPDE